MHRTLLRTTVATLAAFAALQPIAAHADIFATIHAFGRPPDGQIPSGRLLPMNGVLIGTTQSGGAGGTGTIYSLDPVTGASAILYSFRAIDDGRDGRDPFDGVVELDGLLYGTTAFGGANDGGTIFSFDPATGTETVVYSFGNDGSAYPLAGLIVANGRLFGTTSRDTLDNGTVFSFDPATGVKRTLHVFTGSPDGSFPKAPLALAGGMLYGTTYGGGVSDVGTLFSVDPRTGAETVLHSIEPVLGRGNPQAGVVFHDGKLFGSTRYGGVPACGFGGIACGSVWQYDLATGVTTELYAMQSQDDGFEPSGQMVFADGVLFGTTEEGGPFSDGTVFAIDVATHEKRSLHVFGQRPYSGRWAQGLTGFDGALYGVTNLDGSYQGAGTVFEMHR